MGPLGESSADEVAVRAALPPTGTYLTLQLRLAQTLDYIGTSLGIAKPDHSRIS